MSEEEQNPIIDLIGVKNFSWLRDTFSKETRLSDVPFEILESISRLDIASLDFSSAGTVTGIALLTFAYTMVGKVQEPRHGSNDLMLVKVLARSEIDFRKGSQRLDNPMWHRPLCDLITGEVGQRIRSERLMTNRMV